MKKAQYRKLRKNSKYIKAVLLLCKDNNINCSIKHRSDNSKYRGLNGFCSAATEKITLNIFNETTTQVFVSSACHEISHVLCKRQGKYANYHSPKPLKNRTIKELKQLIKISLKAEKYVDVIGKGVCSITFPEIKYIPTYWKESGKYGHQRYYNDRIRYLIKSKRC